MKVKIYQIGKRIFDIIASILGIIVTSPIWLIAIIGIEISDPGPIFYDAQRIGKDNKKFTMYKFRSMRLGRVNESVFRGEENRIFPFGRFMRRTKIDELPQLFCVLIGDMSVIGPRPAAKDQMRYVRGGRYSIISTVKPGLSGPGALYDYIYGDTITDETEYMKEILPKRLDLEMYYVEHKSWKYDLKLIWYTIVCILSIALKRKPRKIFAELIECISSKGY